MAMKPLNGTKKGNMNRKAVFFSVLTIFIIMLLMLFVKPYDYSYEHSKLPTNKLILSHYDNNLKAIENDYIRYAVYDTLMRSMRAYNEFLINKNSHASTIDEARDSLREVMVNNDAIDPSTGNSVNLKGYIEHDLDGLTLDDRIAEIEEIAANYLNINLEITYDKNNDIEIYQCGIDQCGEEKATGPWFLGVKFTYHLTMDQSPIAKWDHHRTLYVKVPIENRIDLLYYLNSNPPKEMRFKQSHITGWDYTNFTEFIDDRAYTKRLTGMSYLQRLANLRTEDITFEGSNIDITHCCAIESIINRSESFIESPVVPPRYGYKDASFTDHCYFRDGINDDNGICDSPFHNISGITNKYYPLQLTEQEIDYYNLNEYSI